jgi:hypothetical protein
MERLAFYYSQQRKITPFYNPKATKSLFGIVGATRVKTAV